MRKGDGKMAEVIVINPTKSVVGNVGKIRVGAYIRVSSNSDDQENSYMVQYDYYSKLIAANPDWVFVDIYADEGITGTEMSKRDEFNRMYQDCKDGKLDLIITKSVSRFARNTLDCVEIARNLKMFGVGVKFEKENINTMNMASEVELAALGSIAQEESMSISKNVRMGIRYRMSNGTFKQGNLPYGFKTENDMWIIVEEQAKIIRLIFNAYINGNSMRRIADQLKQAKVIKNDGTYNWNEKYIGYILRNVRYKGDALLQKSYTEEFPFKTKINHGERDMYYVKNSNPAIMNAEVFDKANKLLDEQGKRFRPNTVSKENFLAKKIYCKECGTMYRKKSGDVKVFWVCRKRDHNSSECPAPQIAETVIYNGFVNVYNRLVNNTETILAPIVGQLTEYRNRRLTTAGTVININKEIAELSEQILMYQAAKSQGYMESALFLEECNKVSGRIAELKKEKKMLTENDDCEKAIKKTEKLISILKTAGAIGEFDKNIFDKTIERVWIDKDKHITYELINGLKLEIDSKEAE